VRSGDGSISQATNASAAVCSFMVETVGAELPSVKVVRFSMAAGPRLASLIQACAYQAAVALNAPMLPAAPRAAKVQAF
jgi:hypothetical protein